MNEINEKKITKLDKFKIYPKLDWTDFSEEFEKEVENAEGIEIQFFDENGKTANIDIKSRVNIILGRYPNIKEVTIHPPISNYDLEHVLFKDEKIFEKQLQDIIEVSEKHNITVNLLYHTTWSTDTLISTGLIDKIKNYIKILEGHESKLLIENVYMLEEKSCTPLAVCKLIDHPNLKVCLDTTHIHVRSIIWRKDFNEYLKEYLDKDLCEKYVHQIHLATVWDNDGFIDHSTHGRVHKTNEDLDLDLQWLNEYNLLNKVFITEVSEENYRVRTDQFKEIQMLREEAKKYM